MPTRVLIYLLGLIGAVAAAQAADNPSLSAGDTCLPGITAAEQASGLPKKLLQTIAIVESGRPDPVNGRVTPWPWTINVGGIGHFFTTKAAAIEAVQELQTAGIRSVDIGCMQINLMHHPAAFASLDDAFDPSTNTRYGARFLSALYRETGNWPQAAAAYHSRTRDIGAGYETRVMAIWPLANQFPDVTLSGRATAPKDDLSNYTPELATRIRQMRADFARLSAMAGPLTHQRQQPAKPAGPDYSRYTPELASQLKTAARSTPGRTSGMGRSGGQSLTRLASRGD